MSRFRTIPAVLVVLMLASPLLADTVGDALLVDEPSADASQVLDVDPGFSGFEAVGPDELGFLVDLFVLQTIDRSDVITPQSLSSGCYYACRDIADSGDSCPPGHYMAFEATGPYYACQITGVWTCVTSGCVAHVSNCRSLATSCYGF